MDAIVEEIVIQMRYIADADGYLQAVSFGAEITCDGAGCTEYVGGVPDGYGSLEAWYAANCELLHKWKVVDYNLVEDTSAVDPENLCQADFVIESGLADGWTWRKWASGVAECWGGYDVADVECNTAAGALYTTGVIEPDLPFPDGVFVETSDSQMGVQMTFVSAAGAFVGSCSTPTPADGAGSFTILAPASGTVTGRMQYHYTGRWKAGRDYFVPLQSSGLTTADLKVFTVRR